MYLSDTSAIKVVQAATVLHNFLTPKNTDLDQLMAGLTPQAENITMQLGISVTLGTDRDSDHPQMLWRSVTGTKPTSSVPLEWFHGNWIKLI